MKIDWDIRRTSFHLTNPLVYDAFYLFGSTGDPFRSHTMEDKLMFGSTFFWFHFYLLLVLSFIMRRICSILSLIIYLCNLNLIRKHLSATNGDMRLVLNFVLRKTSRIWINDMKLIPTICRWKFKANQLQKNQELEYTWPFLSYFNISIDRRYLSVHDHILIY